MVRPLVGVSGGRDGLPELALGARLCGQRARPRDAPPLRQGRVEAGTIAAQTVYCMKLQLHPGFSNLSELSSSRLPTLAYGTAFRRYEQTESQPIVSPHQVTRGRFAVALPIDVDAQLTS